MPRVRSGAARHRRKVAVRKAVKGYRTTRRTNYRLAKEAITRSGVFARRDRRQRKRKFRALWIIRLSAACRAREMSYSVFICGLKKAGIELNRKVLSELAISDPEAFDEVAAAVKAAA